MVEDQFQNKFNDGQVLDIRGAAAYIGLKRSRVRYLLYKRLIPSLKIGRSVRFRKSDLDVWLNKFAIPEAPSPKELSSQLRKARRSIREEGKCK